MPTYAVEFADIACFTISAATRTISVTAWDDSVSATSIEHLLVDQVWPRIIAHQGRLVLHAAGVATPAGAILIVGPSGHGKSTLAASLDQSGHRLLGDDAMIISDAEGRSTCAAVYRSLRLFPDSIERLFVVPPPHSEVASYSDKRNVHLPAPAHHAEEHGVRAIFFIDRDDDQPAPDVTRLLPADACMRLVEHSFWLDPTDLDRTATKLRAAGCVASRVPAFRLRHPGDYARLAAVHAAMFAALD